MDCLFEILFQLFAEFFLGAFLELTAEAIGRFVRWLFGPLTRANNDADPRARNLRVGLTLLWALAGVAAGFLSLLVFPRAFIHATALHVLNLILTPILMAAVMVQLGDLLARHDRRRTALNHFASAYAFALAYLLIRFFFAT